MLRLNGIWSNITDSLRQVAQRRGLPLSRFAPHDKPPLDPLLLGQSGRPQNVGEETKTVSLSEAALKW